MGSLFGKQTELTLIDILLFKPVYRLTQINEIDEEIKRILFQVEESELHIKHFGFLYFKLLKYSGAVALINPNLFNCIFLFLNVFMKDNTQTSIQDLVNFSLTSPFVFSNTNHIFLDQLANYIKFLEFFPKIDNFIEKTKKQLKAMRELKDQIDPSNSKDVLDWCFTKKFRQNGES